MHFVSTLRFDRVRLVVAPRSGVAIHVSDYMVSVVSSLPDGGVPRQLIARRRCVGVHMQSNLAFLPHSLG